MKKPKGYYLISENFDYGIVVNGSLIAVFQCEQDRDYSISELEQVFSDCVFIKVHKNEEDIFVEES